MNRAYSLLTLKSVDDDKRILEGIATTPETDRMGDVVVPKGAEFKLPLPFLWQHNSAQPIGHVTKAKVTNAGIEVQVQLVKIDEPGTLKNRLDEAWQSIKAGLVRGLSIGFSSIESARIDGTGGIKFLKWSWLELSAVTIPANAEASITTLKSIDAPLLAATGKEPNASDRTAPGATGKKPLSLSPAKEAKHVKTIQEQITEWEGKRAHKANRQSEIMTKSLETGATLDEAEGEEHDTLGKDIAQIDVHLKRLEDMQKQMVTKAVPARGGDPEVAALSRRPDATPGFQVLEPKLEKGIGFARLAQAMYLSSKTNRPIEDIAKDVWPNWGALHQKNVAAGTTTGTNWALPLVNYQILAGEFAEFLRPLTILGKFGTGNIPSLRKVPFNVKIPRQTSKGSAYWVGEGKPKPLTEWQMDSITMLFTKVATIAVITEELLRFSNPSAEQLVRDELAAAVVERIDLDFIDPANSGTSTVKPASITSGAFTAISGGDTAAFVNSDMQALLAPFNQANIPISSAVLLMNANVALALSLMLTTNGQRQYPDISMNGGTFLGLPVIVSQYIPTATVILVAASEILLADDGNVSIDLSREASLEMLASGSSQTAVTGTGASLVSMFQTNSVAFRAEREINWSARRSSAVAYLTSANWGGTVGSGDI